MGAFQEEEEEETQLAAKESLADRPSSILSSKPKDDFGSRLKSKRKIQLNRSLQQEMSELGWVVYLQAKIWFNSFTVFTR